MAGKGNNTQYLDLEGKIKWANGRSGGLFTQDPEYGSYKCQLYPTQESWDKIKKSGLDLKARNDEDGDYIIFKRPHDKLFMGDRKATYFGPPKVFFVEGIKPTRDIGNNSDVRVSVSVYQAGRFLGHRLNEVIVTNLVEFKREGAIDRSGLTELKNDAEEDEAEEREAMKETAPWDDEVPFGDEPKEEKPAKSVNPFKKRG